MESFKPEAVSMLLNEASSLSQRLQSVITEVRNGRSVRAAEQADTVLQGLQDYSRIIDEESELAAQLTTTQRLREQAEYEQDAAGLIQASQAGTYQELLAAWLTQVNKVHDLLSKPARSCTLPSPPSPLPGRRQPASLCSC